MLALLRAGLGGHFMLKTPFCRAIVPMLRAPFIND